MDELSQAFRPDLKTCFPLIHINAFGLDCLSMATGEGA